MEELQLVSNCGEWKTRFTWAANHKSGVELREVHQLQKKQAVSLYLLICGLDDQDAADWEKDPKSNLLRSDPI